MPGPGISPTSRTASAERRTERSFARGPVLAVAAVVTVAHTILAVLPRRWFDEDLMVAIGRYHLDWGSADQPPVTPLLARLADTVAPGSGLVLAVPAILATGAAVVVAALIAHELDGDRRAQTITAFAQATGLTGANFGHLLTPYSIEPLQWLVLCWLLVRWVRLRDDRLLLVLGVVAGIAAQTKFQVMLLGVVVLLSVAAVGPRELLRRPALWAGVAIAAVIAAPTLLWQAANGWPQLAMGAIVEAEVESTNGGRIALLFQWILMAGIVGAVLLVIGIGAALTRPELRPVRFLAVAFLGLLAVFVVTSGRHYYLAGLYGVLAAMGAVALQRRREAGSSGRPWVARIGAALSVGLAVFMMWWSVVLAAPSYADTVIATTVRAYESLAPEERDRIVVMTQPFTLATYLDSAPPTLGLPPASSPSRAYGWFPPPEAGRDQVLLVGDPDVLRPWFTSVRQVGVVEADPTRFHVGLLPQRPGIWLLSGQKAPWTTIWPQIRTLRVM